MRELPGQSVTAKTREGPYAKATMPSAGSSAGKRVKVPVVKSEEERLQDALMNLQDEVDAEVAGAAELPGMKRRLAEEAVVPIKYCRLTAFHDVKTFFFKKTELRELSNFADIAVTIDSITYPTGEHCFHAHKYLHAAMNCASKGGAAARVQQLRGYADQFRSGGPIAADGLAAKRAGGKKGLALNDIEMQGWTSAGEAVQLRICQNKVAQPEVRDCLLATGEAYLLHQDNRAKPDTPWGGKIPGLKEKLSAAKLITASEVIGENRLGLIWMRVRHDCRQPKEDPGASE